MQHIQGGLPAEKTEMISREYNMYLNLEENISVK